MAPDPHANASAPETASGIDLNPIIEQVIAEIRELEQAVTTKTAELQTVRERLAAARGKMEMIGTLQQLSATNGRAQP